MQNSALWQHFSSAAAAGTKAQRHMEMAINVKYVSLNVTKDAVSVSGNFPIRCQFVFKAKVRSEILKGTK